VRIQYSVILYSSDLPRLGKLAAVYEPQWTRNITAHGCELRIISTIHKMPSLLASVDCTSQVHLIVGSNPLAAARCAKSLEVGAKPILVTSEEELNWTLRKRVEDGEVTWVKKEFEDEDIMKLGREEVGGVVDTVFVTLGPRNPLSTLSQSKLTAE
jgi:hypothetical protein